MQAVVISQSQASWVKATSKFKVMMLLTGPGATKLMVTATSSASRMLTVTSPVATRRRRRPIFDAIRVVQRLVTRQDLGTTSQVLSGGIEELGEDGGAGREDEGRWEWESWKRRWRNTWKRRWTNRAQIHAVKTNDSADRKASRGCR